MPIIKGQILEGSIIHTDGCKICDALILSGYEHYRVHHSKDEFARGKSLIKRTETFWASLKDGLLNSTDFPTKLAS